MCDLNGLMMEYRECEEHGTHYEIKSIGCPKCWREYMEMLAGMEYPIFTVNRLGIRILIDGGKKENKG